MAFPEGDRGGEKREREREVYSLHLRKAAYSIQYAELFRCDVKLCPKGKLWHRAFGANVFFHSRADLAAQLGDSLFA